MKFTDGFWALRPGVDALYAQEAYELRATEHALHVLAPTRVIASRGDTLNRPALTVSLDSPLPGVIGVTIEHHRGAASRGGFELVGAEEGHGEARVDDDGAVLTSGDLTARVARGAPWSLTFASGDRVLTSSGAKSIGYLRLDPGAAVEPGPTEAVAPAGRRAVIHEQLALGIGEHIYGLGERFGPLVKNGQSIDIWNADGGTSSEQAYKNVPFYLSDRGYGVLVDDPGRVSFEIGSEAVERVQFSVGGERLRYYVIAGDPATVLERYTRLTGRPARVPAWSYGLWLSTSFTTDYDETTVAEFLDGMARRELPLSVFHFDCFWMREFHWTDFRWDERVFPDPEGMLARLHERELRVSAWLNPYIAQESELFEEGRRLGHLVRRADGSVWQWDMWQAGMALVDFTSPEATAWFQDHVRTLLRSGVDCVKTDFGERVPLDVVWHDGSDPEAMHNRYAQLYNRAVFEVLEGERGEGEAVLFARSATVGGQRLPVHWGGDSTSTFASMAESLRGGLSLALSGFGFWSHDIGGFEGTPDPAVFKRWVAFGLLSSHSRLHGSSSYRVPWLFDAQEGRDEADPESAVAVTRRFLELKLELMPSLYAAGLAAHATGLPVMRPMALAYPGDPAVAHLDRQYLLGPDLLVAPVFDESGEVEFYLPAGGWTHLLTGERVAGGAWRRERHGFDSLPLYVPDGAVLATSPGARRPDHAYLDGLELRAFPPAPEAAGAPSTGERRVRVTEPGGREAEFTVRWDAARVTATGPDSTQWTLRVGDEIAAAHDGEASIPR
ncbi:MAG: alpha-xylosidase [Actinomycetales bacterium]|nr:alpha-xylosidase [Actinomycetales bacterium]